MHCLEFFFCLLISSFRELFSKFTLFRSPCLLDNEMCVFLSLEELERWKGILRCCLVLFIFSFEKKKRTRWHLNISLLFVLISFFFCSLKYIKEPFPAFALFEVRMCMFGAILFCLTVFLVAILYFSISSRVLVVFFIQKTNENVSIRSSLID